MSQEEPNFDRAKFLKRLGKQIARVRKSRAYSQDRLCLEAGLSRGTMSKIEAGLADPKASTLYRISATLDVSVKKLMDLEA